LAKIKARKAICLAWRGELESSRALFNEIEELDLDAEIKTQITACLELIKAREESI
jgi:hypothetical protein